MRSLKYIKYYENYGITYSKNIQKILESYLECVIFTDEESVTEMENDNNEATYKIDNEHWNDSEIKTMMHNIDFNIYNFDEDTLIDSYLDIKKFLKLVGNATNDIDESSIGCDIWLTRNGHGAGFWDRGYDEDISKILTDSAKSLKEVHLYVSDDGKLSIQ